MIHRVPFLGPRQEPDPVSEVELGVAVVLLILIVLLAAIVVPAVA